MRHYPVLLEEAIEYLSIDPKGVYVDCTFGEGGHSEAILKQLTSGRLIALDRDLTAIEAGRERLAEYRDKLTLIHSNYSNLAEFVTTPVKGILADVGLSRRQLEDAERGFSFLREGPLSMAMDQGQRLTAETIVNHYGERQLADLIYQFGEERRSRGIARAIVRGRPIRTTTHLAEIVEKAVPRTARRRIHAATKTFQGIRIAVNDELDELAKLLEVAPSLLSPGGRMVAISFHSLEDRLVKQSFRSWKQQGVFDVLTRRIVRPSLDEIRKNPASRSAKLRASKRTALEWPHQN